MPNYSADNKRVVLGMSGGVDSTVSAYLLQKQGYEVIGVTFVLWCDSHYPPNTQDTVQDAKKVCDKLGIKHHVLDISDKFKKYVVDDFIEKYSMCRTPNPCIECNRHIKFGEMFDFADSIGAKYVATGHYARCVFDGELGTYVIKKSASEKKDQSYVLYVIKKEYIPRILFPLGDFTSKDDIRQLASEQGFVTAHKRDSQEICFIPDNDTQKFLDYYIKSTPGNIIDCNNNVLGKHIGLSHYTIGQRKGLGVAAGKPVFITKLDKKKNTVTVGSNDDLFSNTLFAQRLNWLTDITPSEPIRVTAKIRYAAKCVPATVYLQGDTAKVVFDEPQRAATSGQSVVFYTDDRLIGGGIII